MQNADGFELLNKRVQFEKSVVAQPIDGPVQVKLAKDGKSIAFFHGNISLVAKIERPLIHQLGSRIWGIQDYSQINTRWQRLIASRQLEQELAMLFQRHDLVARHYQDAAGVNRVYGFVSPSFVDVNPLNFRQQFIEQVRQTTAYSLRSKIFTSAQNGDVTEWFDFDSTGFQTEYKYGLHYARNSGYDAYKVYWGRNIIVCTNQLKKWEGSISRWKHTRELAMADFIDSTIREGVGNQQWLEQRIDASRANQFAKDEFDELMARLSLAAATKERVRSRVEVEAQDVGNNEWALSQALTWLGSHDRHISTWSKQQLTTLGTEVLERSLPTVLTAEASAKGDGMYGILLPAVRVYAV
jgi:hypothetical protein